MINSVKWCWIFIVLNITGLISDIEAKPFSINEALAKEAALKKNGSLTNTDSEQDLEQYESKPKISSRRKLYKSKYSSFEEDSPEFESEPKNPSKRKYYKPKYSSYDFSSERFPLLRSLGLKPLKITKHKKASALLLPKRKRYTPTKYKDLLQLRLPLKSRKILSHRPSRQTQRHQVYLKKVRDEVDNRYVPLAKTISMLLSDIIPKHSGESTEQNSKYYTEEREDAVCTCSRKPKRIKPRKKTVTLPPVNLRIPHSTQDQAEAATTTTNHTTHSNLGSVRQNKNISSILPRNTSSHDGDHNGLSEGSSTTFHGSTQGYITRDHRDHELDTRDKRNETRTTNDEEDTRSLTRNCTSSRGHDRGTAEFRRQTVDGPLLESQQENETNKASNEHTRLEIHPQLATGRNATELPEIIRERTRKSISEDKINIGRQSLQPKNNDEKSNNSIPKYFTSHQRFFERNGSTTEKDKEIRRTNERLVSIRDIRNPFDAMEAEGSGDSYVVIIDGYSVTAGKSLMNKFKPN